MCALNQNKLQNLKSVVSANLTGAEHQLLGPEAVEIAARVLLRTAPFTQRGSFSLKAFFDTCCTLPECGDVTPDSPKLPESECQAILDLAKRIDLLVADPDDPERLMIRNKHLHDILRHITRAT